MATIPDQLRSNAVATLLDELRVKYGKLSRTGKLYGLIVADQDAKVLAANTFFHHKLNYWDVGAIGAALYGVGKQARDFFQAQDLDRATLIFGDFMFFTHIIGTVSLGENPNQTRELILISIGERNINLGLVVMLMQKFAPRILHQVEHDEKARNQMRMSESEFTHHLEDLKKQLFSLTESSIGGII